ncbi:hypothetical protein HanIR_Chr12g0585611 [Helianthus annuus]|nr:hypothetical protein HanIR_Chr12g0585611 [Helianthus annuus]
MEEDLKSIRLQPDSAKFTVFNYLVPYIHDHLNRSSLSLSLLHHSLFHRHFKPVHCVGVNWVTVSNLVRFGSGYRRRLSELMVFNGGHRLGFRVGKLWNRG